jgi:hypothetical protein
VAQTHCEGGGYIMIGTLFEIVALAAFVAFIMVVGAALS